METPEIEIELPRGGDFRSVPMSQALQIIGESRSAKFAHYQPGNGTDYKLILFDTQYLGLNHLDIRRIGFYMGLTPGCYIAVWVQAHRSMVLQREPKLLHWNYVREKLAPSPSDAVVLAEALGTLTNRPFIPSYDERTGTPYKTT